MWIQIFLRDTPLDQLLRLRLTSKGLALSNILHRQSWSRESTWQKFYNNHVISPEGKFQQALLRNN